MPDRQHTSHCDIHVPICFFIHRNAEFQQLDDFLIHLYRTDSCIVIDGLDVIHPLIVVINIIQIIIVLKLVFDQGHLFRKLLL